MHSAGGFLLTHQSLEHVLHCRQLVPVGRPGDLNYRAYYEMGSGLTFGIYPTALGTSAIAQKNARPKHGQRTG
jgi:hypothetical protein